MNLLDHYVEQIISEPYFKYNKWCLDVIAECYGRRKHTLMRNTEEEIKSIKIGYMFLA